MHTNNKWIQIQKLTLIILYNKNFIIFYLLCLFKNKLLHYVCIINSSICIIGTLWYSGLSVKKVSF